MGHTLPLSRRARAGTVIGAALVAAGLWGAGPGSASAEAAFGAVAADPATGAWGFSNRYGTRAAAEARALRECRMASSGTTCRGIAWVRNGCVAAAVIRRSDGSLRRITWGIGVTRAQAQLRARAKAGAGSRILVWSCSG